MPEHEVLVERVKLSLPGSPISVVAISLSIGRQEQRERKTERKMTIIIIIILFRMTRRRD